MAIGYSGKLSVGKLATPQPLPQLAKTGSGTRAAASVVKRPMGKGKRGRPVRRGNISRLINAQLGGQTLG